MVRTMDFSSWSLSSDAANEEKSCSPSSSGAASANASSFKGYGK